MTSFSAQGKSEDAQDRTAADLRSVPIGNAIENLLSFAPKLNMKTTEFMVQRFKKNSRQTNESLPTVSSGGNPDTAAAIRMVFFSEGIPRGALE